MKRFQIYIDLVDLLCDLQDLINQVGVLFWHSLHVSEMDRI